MSFKIKDICEINRDSLGKKDNIKYISYLDTSNLKLGTIDEIQRLIVGEHKIPSRAKRKVKIDDILISTVRPNQKHYGIVKKEINNMVVSTGFAVLTPNKNIVNPNYLYNYLTQNEITEYLQGIAETSTTAYPSIKPSDIGELEIELPPIEEQKAIAKILSDLDNKIEVNNKINKRLEDMAQTIFKHWFVDFEFPNEEGKPYKSSGGEMIESELGMIPKGWEVIELDEIVKIYNGYSYKGKELSESNNAMVTIKNFDKNGGYKIDGLKEIVIYDKVKEHHYVDIGDIIVAHTDLTQGAEIIANPIIITSKSGYDKLIMSMDTVKVESKKNYISNNIIYMILKDRRFKGYALGYMNGTTVLHLSKKCIPSYKIAISSDKKLFRELEKVILPLINVQINIIKQNESFSNLRDTLLPKLISGKIRVLTDK